MTTMKKRSRALRQKLARTIGPSWLIGHDVPRADSTRSTLRTAAPVVMPLTAPVNRGVEAITNSKCLAWRGHQAHHQSRFCGR